MSIITGKEIIEASSFTGIVTTIEFIMFLFVGWFIRAFLNDRQRKKPPPMKLWLWIHKKHQGRWWR